MTRSRAQAQQNQSECAMTGLRVLAMLPAYTEDRATYLVRLLTAAKQRWGWHVDLFCSPSDRDAFGELTTPAGKLFTAPDSFRQATWEGDPQSVATINHKLSEAEFATGVPAGQLILASQATIGRAFVAPVQHTNLTEFSARVLEDNTEAFRIIRRMYQFADELVETAKPDLLLAYEWEKPWRSTVWMAAASRGIACVAIRRSKLHADHYYWTTDRTLFNTAARESAVVRSERDAPVSDAAVDYIRNFREQPKTVKYVQAKWQQEKEKSWLRWHAQFVRDAMRYYIGFVTGRNQQRRKWLLRKLVTYNLRFVLGPRQQRFFRTFDDEQLQTLRYIYFPMHKETDLPLVFQAPRWHDQRNTIQVLAGTLPLGYRLLVREHRFNVGRRPMHYYRDLSRLPNVVLIDAFDSQFKYIRNADLVVTENGTSGWEALLLGRRAITLSRTSYDGAALARKVEDFDRLGAAILRALREPAVADAAAHDRRLGWMIDAERATTFPMAETGIPVGLDQFANLIAARLRQNSDLPREHNLVSQTAI